MEVADGQKKKVDIAQLLRLLQTKSKIRRRRKLEDNE